MMRKRRNGYALFSGNYGRTKPSWLQIADDLFQRDEYRHRALYVSPHGTRIANDVVILKASDEDAGRISTPKSTRHAS